MNSSSCLDSIPSNQGACQVPRSKQTQSQYTEYTSGEPGALISAERTRGAVAVSGVNRESRGELKTLPGIPKTNSGFPLPRGSLFIVWRCGGFYPGRFPHAGAV